MEFTISINGWLVVGDIDPTFRDGCPECARLRLTALRQTLVRVAEPTGEGLADLQHRLRHQPDSGSKLVTNVSTDPPFIWSTPLPDCPQCDAIRPRQLTSDHSRRVRPALGGFRNQSADEFVEGLRFFVGSVGIMTGAFEQRSVASGTAFFNALQLLGSDTRDLEVAGGKGDAQADALASCYGEGVERWALTGVNLEAPILASRRQLGDVAVDPVREWGFPVRDDNPLITPYAPDLPIHWYPAEELTIGESETWTLVPGEVVTSPPPSSREAFNISVGSTNGTAGGGSILDATTQAILELVERDAYWFYMRTDACPKAVPSHLLPARVSEIVDANRDIRYTIEVLENPFSVPIVQVLATMPQGGSLLAGRGTGAHFTLGAAISRAFNECNQMLTSLLTGMDVAPSIDHMRALWYAGSATTVFANAFAPEMTPWLHLVDVDETSPLTDLLARLGSNGHKVFRTILHESDEFAVVRCSASGLGAEDPLYYEGSKRFDEFAQAIGIPTPNISYTGTLFM